MSEELIRFHDFGVAYEKKTVLEGVNTAIRPGRITAIIGPSGCGKSTLLKAMNRMLDPEGCQSLWLHPLKRRGHSHHGAGSPATEGGHGVPDPHSLPDVHL